MALYAFDGTWNDSSAPDPERDRKKDTNVHRFRICYSGKVCYEPGVGTRYGLLGKLIGGFGGAGAKQRLNEQFLELIENLRQGDDAIDIIGYSRGAAIARMFVHKIEQEFERLSLDGKVLRKPPRVRFLGLFDTVASFGVPWNEREHNFDHRIPDFVDNTYHAMALDETRETFGIERCIGNRERITEVWFRGGHGDIGGNATYVDHKDERGNRERSDIALNWMLAKARACGLPVLSDSADTSSPATSHEAPITAEDEPISIGNAGTLSRRIHLGDLVHHSLERTKLTQGIDGRLLRRINVVTRIEDEDLSRRREAMNWIPPITDSHEPDNVTPTQESPSIVTLSLRRYPFDTLPARTWLAWLRLWQLEDAGIAEGRQDEFWAPTPADRALAWDLLVELEMRITVQKLNDDEGNDAAALKSVYELFPLSREAMRRHGVGCANTASQIGAFLNKHVRHFTASWHKNSMAEGWEDQPEIPHKDFRLELRDEIQPKLRQLADALSDLADAKVQ